MRTFTPNYGKWEETDYVEPDWHGIECIRIPNGGLLCTQCKHVYKKDLLFDRSKCPNCGRDMR